MMDSIEHIDFKPGEPIAVFRLIGDMPIEVAIRTVGEALGQVAGLRITRMMIVITESGGFAAPSLAQRAEMVRQWAAAAGGVVRPAMVCAADLIDPENFGVIMASRFGMIANVFEDESDALAWLRALQ